MWASVGYEYSAESTVWPGEEMELVELSWEEMVENMKRRLANDLHQHHSAVIQHQSWMSEWQDKRKASETEMPQRMEVPQRREAGGGGDTHRQQCENEEFYEVDGDDTDVNCSGENDPGGKHAQSVGLGDQVEQCGQHRCEVAATEDGRCELCMLGCAPGEGTWSVGGYRKCTGCICGCEWVGCISGKGLHAEANRDLLHSQEQIHSHHQG